MLIGQLLRSADPIFQIRNETTTIVPSSKHTTPLEVRGELGVRDSLAFFPVSVPGEDRNNIRNIIRENSDLKVHRRISHEDDSNAQMDVLVSKR